MPVESVESQPQDSAYFHVPLGNPYRDFPIPTAPTTNSFHILLSVDGCRSLRRVALLGGGIVFHGSLQEAVRSEPDLKLSLVGCGHLRLGSVPGLIPGVLTTHETHLLLLPSKRRSPASDWLGSVPRGSVLLRGSGGIVNDSGHSW